MVRREEGRKGKGGESSRRRAGTAGGGGGCDIRNRRATTRPVPLSEGQVVEICWGELRRRREPGELIAAASAFASARGLTAQLFDASALAGEEHLRSAAIHALRAMERGMGRTSSLAMEILLYASGRRQIRDALKLVGVSGRTRRIAAVLIGRGARGRGKELLKALGAAPCGPEAAGGRRALARLGLRGREIDEALEMVALLDIERQ